TKNVNNFIDIFILILFKHLVPCNICNGQEKLTPVLSGSGTLAPTLINHLDG
ncbi:hypothetical protein WANA13_0182, partial [Wolbachia endosymbiont of Drosophila ananassae]